MGAYIVWRSFYSVGDPSLDSQHKQVVDVINDLYAVLEQGTDRAALRSLVDRLVEYTRTHFAYEEQVLQEHDYPDLVAHKALHDAMRQRTADLRRHIGLVEGPELLRALKEWWLNHIQGNDKQYMPYLQVPVQS